MTEADACARLRWNCQDLPYAKVDRAAMAEQQLSFYAVATASFVEIASDLYAQNLIEFFDGDDAVCRWLAAVWEPEEIQHGIALRQYTAAAWPDFNWHRSFERYRKEYATYCNAQRLGPTRALEMARRCVVETGTFSYYTMLQRMAPCPVLAQLAGRIRADEAGHYRQFRHLFLRYSGRELPSRSATAKALILRAWEINGEDGLIAFKHVWQEMNPAREFRTNDYTNFTRALGVSALQHYPLRTAVHMVTGLLGLPCKPRQGVDTAVASLFRALLHVKARQL